MIREVSTWTLYGHSHVLSAERRTYERRVCCIIEAGARPGNDATISARFAAFEDRKHAQRAVVVKSLNCPNRFSARTDATRHARTPDDRQLARQTGRDGTVHWRRAVTGDQLIAYDERRRRRMESTQSNEWIMNVPSSRHSDILCVWPLIVWYSCQKWPTCPGHVGARVQTRPLPILDLEKLWRRLRRSDGA